MSSHDSSNSTFSLAADLINCTSRSIFLTGKAGTGKTTFLRHIAKTTHKNFVIAAPTGVAAINAVGMTLHSLFQLPFGIYLPGYHDHTKHNSTLSITNRSTLFKNLHLTKSKRDLLQELELLIIDEVSMVRCDMLDAVDTILRAVRKKQQPFGGVQVLFIGDLFQLSPVAKNDEWNVLKEHYESPFFFHAKVVNEVQLLCVELTKIYRQNEQTFIDLLNNVRNNKVTTDDLTLLNSRIVQGSVQSDAVTLTTHNYKADEINARELNKLSAKAFRFSASVEGDFPDRNFPTDVSLTIKKGARIMFIKNDTSEEKEYFNGKLATVTYVDESDIEVEFDSGETFDLRRETWRNIRYQYNTKEDNIDEEELGSFTQFPIRLAWAITIHKSQGLTFEKAIIDAGESFAPGQVYVALSRCTSLAGMELKTRITHQQILTDPKVMAYTEQLHNEAELAEQLERGKSVYEKERFTQLFNFEKIHLALVEWSASLAEKQLPDKKSAEELSKELLNNSRALQEVAGKTQQWIDRNHTKAYEINNFEEFVRGLKKSVAHFHNLLHKEFITNLREHQHTLKNKTKVKKYNKEIFSLIMVIAGKAKKISEAHWEGEVLFEGKDETLKETVNKAREEESKPKVNSAWESKLLHDKGISMEAIAEARGLALSTIEGHIAKYVKTGDIRIATLLDAEKLKTISEAFEKLQVTNLTPVKEMLGEGYSYGEIRMVFNHLEYTKTLT